MNRYVTLLKREYWEHRGGFLWAPVWTAAALFALMLIGMLVATWHANRTFDGEIKIGVPLMKLLSEVPPEEMAKLGLGYEAALSGHWMILQAVLFFVLFFYLLGALYDDRRDRSILFWKSLPVSDAETVLGKVAVAAIGAPLIAWAVTVLLHFAFLGMLGLFVLGHGLSAMDLVWGPAEPLALAAKLLATVPVNALWAMPAIGWLLLVSAFARSKPFLWAVALPVAVGVAINTFELLEAIRVPDTWYWQHVVARILTSLVPASWFGKAFIERMEASDKGGDAPEVLLDWSMIGSALGSMELWIGVVAGVAMIIAAIHFRRTRELAD
jgi:ABC-2 type transport system permease protein